MENSTERCPAFPFSSTTPSDTDYTINTDHIQSVTSIYTESTGWAKNRLRLRVAKVSGRQAHNIHSMNTSSVHTQNTSSTLIQNGREERVATSLLWEQNRVWGMEVSSWVQGQSPGRGLEEKLKTHNANSKCHVLIRNVLIKNPLIIFSKGISSGHVPPPPFDMPI